MARTHRPPTLGKGVMEAKEEEGSAGGRQVVGARSWEAEAQGGRPGAGAGGMGEVPQVTFSCSSVTYLGQGQTQEGIQDVNGAGMQEMALPMGEGWGRVAQSRGLQSPQGQESQSPLSMVPSSQSRRPGPPRAVKS